jgi:hypothetical protein
VVLCECRKKRRETRWQPVGGKIVISPLISSSPQRVVRAWRQARLHRVRSYRDGIAGGSEPPIRVPHPSPLKPYPLSFSSSPSSTELAADTDRGTWRNPSRRPQEEVKAISKDDCAMPSRISGDLLYPGLNTNRPSSAAAAVAASSSAPISTPSTPASTQIGRPGVQRVLVFLYQTPTLSAAADLRRSRAVRSQIGGGGKKTTRDGRPDAVPFPQ